MTFLRDDGSSRPGETLDALHPITAAGGHSKRSRVREVGEAIVQTPTRDDFICFGWRQPNYLLANVYQHNLLA